MTATRIKSGSNGNLMEYISGMGDNLAHRSKQEYTSRLKTISKSIANNGGPLTPAMLLNELKRIAEERLIADSTFRMYKAAVMYWIGEQAKALMASNDDVSAYADAFSDLRSIRYATIAGGPERTSAKKLKAFPQNCVDTLEKHAKDHGHRAPNSIRAAAFAKANLLVGLRPVEWFDASFASYFVRDANDNIVRDDQGRIVFQYMLVVDNAKATHGRGNGQRRELILYGITADELKAIMYFLEIARKFRDRHSPDIEPKQLTNALYRPMNNLIRRVLSSNGYSARDIPSVYSTRHQVVADFKASGIDKRVIAAFFGHSSVATHREHYSHKRNGSRGMTFRPSPASIERVKVHGTTHRPETMSPQLATDAADWFAEQESRKMSGP